MEEHRMTTPPIVRRRALVRSSVLCAGLVLAPGGAAWAQEPDAQAQPQSQPQQAQAPAPSTQVTFPLDGGVIFWQIKPDRTADFEFVLGKLKEALRASTDPAHKQMAAGWRVFKVQEPAPGGNVYYLFVIEPAVKGADYSSAAMLKLLYDAFPAEAQDLYKRLTESAAGGRNVLNIQLIQNMAQ
jgi:hypothetical protein